MSISPQLFEVYIGPVCWEWLHLSLFAPWPDQWEQAIPELAAGCLPGIWPQVSVCGCGFCKGQIAVWELFWVKRLAWLLIFLSLLDTRRTSKHCTLCTQQCSSRHCWFSSSPWSGRKVQRYFALWWNSLWYEEEWLPQEPSGVLSSESWDFFVK